jgi:hypothetical protein
MSIASRIAKLERERLLASDRVMDALADAWPEVPAALVEELARLAGETPAEAERIWRSVRGGGPDWWEKILNGEVTV